ncbi:MULTISPECIES: replication-relaxation family protein [Nocardiopsis]|uniref:Replication-relaxation family protein n=2 Tax=Nocardiopsis TaxID=2013 RepID=A0ABT4TR80_9ACTN|nr:MULTISPECIES: replication-relaxation family protein [Nocardiopsis]MDA2807182.1 replication-relaxation family protein [Nocardiopsis suaedae]MDA2809902.1 replication-relaxation family protein [Nocardiopsis endophytica]
MRLSPRPDHRDVVRPRTTPEAIHRLISRLTPRDLRIMRLVHRHRVLTTDQIARLEFASYSSAKTRLLTLYRLRALERFRPWTPVGSAPWHYLLDAPGAEILAAEHGTTAREWGYRRDRVLAVAYRSSLDHTIGTNDFFVDLTNLARVRRARLAWRTARECEQQFGDVVRPDAAGHWSEGEHAVLFFLEYDRGTEPLRRLAAKLDAYHELSRLTGHQGTVLFWLPSAKRAENLHRYVGEPPVPAATGVHGAHPADRVWTPFGQTWQRTLAELGAPAPHQPFLPGWEEGGEEPDG